MIEGLFLYFLSPLALALWLGAVALLLCALGRRRGGAILAVGAFAWLWICSTPWVAQQLVGHLESRYPAVRPEDAPQADAILVLGGAVAGARPPQRPTLMLGASSTRVWYAAALYRAGKAPWVIVAAGGRPRHPEEQIEANAISQLLIQLGVPARAIVVEGASLTTRENAANSRAIVQQLRARKVLLVTSALHMPRAMQTFATIWGAGSPELIPAVTDVQGLPGPVDPVNLWFPSLDALINVNKSLKEIAGLVHLAIIQ